VSKEEFLRRLAGGLVVMIWSSATMVEAGALGLGKKAPAYTPSGAWEGYFTNDKGVITGPVLQPPERNKDKDWMFLRFTDYSGPKIRVAVMKVDNKTATAQAAADTEAVAVTNNLAQVPVSSIEEMVATAVFNTNRFELVERKEAEKILEEQDLGASGRAKKSTAPKTGQIVGADYMIFASVNEWTPVKSRGGGAAGSKAGPLGLLGVQKSEAEVAMSFRVVDAATSKLLFSTLERATAGSWGIGLGGVSGNEGGAFAFQKASPIGYAVQSCLNKGVYKLAMWLKDRPWRGAVVKVDGQRVYVNAGINSGFTTGVELVVISQGKELFDPISGESLGKETAVIGILRLTDVQEKYSIAEIVEGCKGLKVGDQVELRNTPPIVVTSKP
jgi:curli biogenesis system outer membrane secretion channel CsgG